MEACGGSHYWGREIRSLGHEVKLLAPHKVTPFRKADKANKNDSHDAKACVTTACVPEMTFVGIKEIWQQDILSLHRVRERLVKNQTEIINEVRGLLLEYGITIPQGVNNFRSALPSILSADNQKLTPTMRSVFDDMWGELLLVMDNIEKIDKSLNTIFSSNDTCQRLAMIEGVGVITATAIYAVCPDPSLFKNGRQFAAWLGLTPGHVQTGGKDSKPIMLGITKHGDPYARKLLVQGSMAVCASVKNMTHDKFSKGTTVR